MRGVALVGAKWFGIGASVMLSSAIGLNVSEERSAEDVASSALAHLDDASEELGLEGVELQLLGSLRVAGGTVVRFAQMSGGVPVLDRGVVARVDPAGRVDHVTSSAEPLAEVTPAMSPTTAAARLTAERRIPGRETAWLAVLPLASGARFVSVVDRPFTRGGQRDLFDVADGKLLQSRSLSRGSLGRVYPISSVVSPSTSDQELTDLTSSFPQYLNGWGGNLQVVNYVSASQTAGNLVVEQVLQPNSGADFLYDPPASATSTTDGFSQVSLYHHLTRGRSYFQGTFGLSMTDSQWKLVAVANYRESGAPFDDGLFSSAGIGSPWNAPNVIALGQGQTFDWTNDSDPILHELTHYVMFNAIGFDQGPLATTSYGLSPFGAAIGEGLADYFASTINGDGTFGEASLALLAAGRDLTDTSKVCPGSLVGDAVLDGALVSSFSWSLRVAFGAAIADQLVFGAAALLVPGATLGDFARGIQQTAEALETASTLDPADLVTINQMLAARGLLDCDEEVELLAGTPRSTGLRGLDEPAVDLGTTCTDLQSNGNSLQSLFHYRAPTAGNQASITFTVDLVPDSGTVLDWNIYVRAGQPVGFGPLDQLPTVADYDHSVTGLDVTSGELTIDASSSPAFVPGQTYYLLLTQRSCGGSTATITRTDVLVPPLFADGFETGDLSRWQ